MARRLFTSCLITTLTLIYAGTSSRSFLAQEAGFPKDAALAATLHPSELMLKAPPLLQAGKGDEATFWFYAGQLRYRSYLAGHPDIDPTGDPAVFSSLFEIVGPPVNGYAFGDIPKLAKTIDAVLEWDRRYPDVSLRSDTHQATRRGLEGLRDSIIANAGSIRDERATHGLPNR